MGHRRARTRLVLPRHLEQRRLSDVGHQQQTIQTAEPGSVRQRLHRGNAGPGACGRRNQPSRPRAGQRDPGRVRCDSVHGLRLRCADREDAVGARGAQGAAIWRPASQEHVFVGDALHRRRTPVCVVRPEPGRVLLLPRWRAALEEAVAAAAHLSRLRHRLVAGGARRQGVPAAGQRAGVIPDSARCEDGRRTVSHIAVVKGTPAFVLEHALHLATCAADRSGDYRAWFRPFVRS